jgi:hypothetical protein
MTRSTAEIILILSLTFSLSACIGAREVPQSDAKVAGNQIGRLKGIMAINDILAARLLDERFDLIRSVTGNANFSEISGLLGGYAGVGIKNKFGNGDPNSVNMLLWGAVLKNFAGHIAETVCISDDSSSRFRDFYQKAGFRLNKEAQALFQDCGARQGSLNWRSNPQALWDLLIQTDAPETEFQAWVSWTKGEEFNRFYQTPRDQLAAAIGAALMNPYFLMER